MTTRGRGSVRIGPISLFALVIILCLAVMAVLSVTTAQATYAAAERQASFTADTYANERAGQEFAADIDAALAPVRAAGGGLAEALACIIDKLNHERSGHIITMEDPIEYVHKHGSCIVTQREVPTDIATYGEALRSAMRESPDVILLGEMRDYETIGTAVTAAEMAQLLFSTLHTTGAAGTVDRIIDAFPASQQRQIRMQLSMVLDAIVSQQLVPTVDGEVVPAFEIMVTNTAIRNLIREEKTHQIDSVIAAGGAEGMRTMDQSLFDLVKSGRVAKEMALQYSIHQEALKKRFETEGL